MKQFNTNDTNLFSRNIVELKLITDRIAEGKGDDAGIFSNTFQVLYLLDKRDNVTPKELINELNIAKSNLAILAKKMIEDGQMESHKDQDNRREIYYNITPYGRELLLGKHNQIEYSCDFETKKVTNILMKAVEELRKLENKGNAKKRRKK